MFNFVTQGFAGDQEKLPVQKMDLLARAGLLRRWLIVAALIIGIHMPLLIVQAKWLWGRAHYQFFPVILVAFVWLLYIRVPLIEFPDVSVGGSLRASQVKILPSGSWQRLRQPDRMSGGNDQQTGGFRFQDKFLFGTESPPGLNYQQAADILIGRNFRRRIGERCECDWNRIFKYPGKGANAV